MVYGTVQGVGFRPAVYRLARELGISGHVRNMGTSVEICVEGNIEDFIQQLKKALPPLASIDYYDILPGEPLKDGFYIVKSKEGQRASFLPADTTLCEPCVQEISEPDNRRYRYPFTNCTDCGARYSVVTDAPFDRERTTMAQFKRCPACIAEYSSPKDRRFHAQTSSCPRCGPRYSLYDSNGAAMDASDPFTVFAAGIDSGGIGVMKAWGGAHVVCSSSSIEHLRKVYGRQTKPFAIMVRDLTAAEKYGVLNVSSRELLTSPQSPIVLVKKRRSKTWLDEAAPGLDRIGLYLPHAAAQHILFQSLETDAVVMTSANLPGQPMCILNKDCLKLPADVYLLHNRYVANRIDDSLVLPRYGNYFFLRKSRGYVPDVLSVPHGDCVVAMGGDMSGCGFVSKEGRGMATQHIGDMGNYDVSLHMGEALKTVMKFSGVSPNNVDCVAVDMHPRYSSRRLGMEFSREWDVPLVEVQHHAAHLYAIMGENCVEDMLALVCDGTGYGEDNTIWGGEVLASSKSRKGYDRLARLRPLPMLGGEKAVEDPRRMVASACLMLDMDVPFFSSRERGIFRKMIPGSVVTSSAGRYLDLVAAWLGVCPRMTYDGEPAMRLEHYLAKGRVLHDLDVNVNTKDGLREVDTLEHIANIAELQPNLLSRAVFSESEKANLACSLVVPVFKKLAEIAADEGDRMGYESIGFTGGVSYNIVLDRFVSEQLRKREKKIIRHTRIPNGDGGVSYGQSVYAGIV